jgi:small subunit ribosomal protein S18
LLIRVGFDPESDPRLVRKKDERPMVRTKSRTEIRKARKRKARQQRKLTCRFCPDGCDNSPRPIYVDYKDVKTLRSMVNRNGHMLSRRRTGCCAKYQRAVRRAVLRARFMGLLPYVPQD